MNITAEANPYRQSYFMEVPLKWVASLPIVAYNINVTPECEEYWEWPKGEKK